MPLSKGQGLEETPDDQLGVTNPTGYRVLDPPPQCCGTCQSFWDDEASLNGSGECGNRGQSEMFVLKWGWCEKWARADD